MRPAAARFCFLASLGRRGLHSRHPARLAADVPVRAGRAGRGPDQPGRLSAGRITSGRSAPGRLRPPACRGGDDRPAAARRLVALRPRPGRAGKPASGFARWWSKLSPACCLPRCISVEVDRRRAAVGAWPSVSAGARATADPNWHARAAHALSGAPGARLADARRLADRLRRTDDPRRDHDARHASSALALAPRSIPGRCCLRRRLARRGAERAIEFLTLVSPEPWTPALGGLPLWQPLLVALGCWTLWCAASAAAVLESQPRAEDGGAGVLAPACKPNR